MLNYLEIAKQALIKHTDKGERRPKYDVFNELNEFDNAPEWTKAQDACVMKNPKSGTSSNGCRPVTNGF